MPTYDMMNAGNDAMKTAIEIPVREIEELCDKFDVVELSLFGSVLRDDFRPESDVDLLVTFREGTSLGPWMSRCFELEEGLSRLLHRRVDLVLRKDVERSENYIRREHILNSAETIFVAR